MSKLKIKNTIKYLLAGTLFGIIMIIISYINVLFNFVSFIISVPTFLIFQLKVDSNFFSYILTIFYFAIMGCIYGIIIQLYANKKIAIILIITVILFLVHWTTKVSLDKIFAELGKVLVDGILKCWEK